MRWWGWVLAAVVVALAALVPFTLSPVIVQFGISTLLLAVLAQGWNIIGGYTGYPSFGNSVFYGLGTYGTAVAMVQLGLPFAAGLGVGAAVAVAFAFLLGIPVLRLRGHYFAITTLALSQAVAAVDLQPRHRGPRHRPHPAPHPRRRDVLRAQPRAPGAATLTVLWLSRSRFGFGLIAIRENEDAAAVMGVNTTLLQGAGVRAAALFSALAGGIHAYWITFIDPASAFDISLNVQDDHHGRVRRSGHGVRTRGRRARAVRRLGVAGERRSRASPSLFFGLVIVAAVVLMPRGLADLVRERFRRSSRLALLRARTCEPHGAGTRPMATSAILEVRDLTQALRRPGRRRRTSASRRTEGEILGVIGPNGAGKTTLVSLISGTLRAERGRACLRGAAMAGVPPFRRARLGIGRTFQIMRPFPGLIVRDNVAVGALFGRGERARPISANARDEARDWLDSSGLGQIRRPARRRTRRPGPQAPRTRQGAGHAAAAAAARRGDGRAQPCRDRRGDRDHPKVRDARHHHPRHRARHQGDQEPVGPRCWCCTTARRSPRARPTRCSPTRA